MAYRNFLLLFLICIFTLQILPYGLFDTSFFKEATARGTSKIVDYAQTEQEDTADDAIKLKKAEHSDQLLNHPVALQETVNASNRWSRADGEISDLQLDILIPPPIMA